MVQVSFLLYNIDKIKLKGDETMAFGNAELDKLIGVRTRSIMRKLKNVTSLPEQNATQLLELGDMETDFGTYGDE